jgi:calmodulin
MASETLREEDVEEIREIFEHFDKNRDGVIQRSEFAALLDALDADLTPEEIQAGLDALDENHNGVIDFDEFVAWWGDRYR